jgi:hypothetical protein
VLNNAAKLTLILSFVGIFQYGFLFPQYLIKAKFEQALIVAFTMSPPTLDYYKDHQLDQLFCNIFVIEEKKEVTENEHLMNSLKTLWDFLPNYSFQTV